MSKAAFVLVDDEKTLLDSLKVELRWYFGKRFTYETAENVSEAWEVIDELQEHIFEVAAVVSDWLMPSVRGDDFLIEVRRTIEMGFF